MVRYVIKRHDNKGFYNQESKNDDKKFEKASLFESFAAADNSMLEYIMMNLSNFNRSTEFYNAHYIAKVRIAFDESSLLE